MDVRGKVEEFGFPANRDINPGRDSRGYRPRTVAEKDVKLIASFFKHKDGADSLGLGFLSVATLERKGV